MSAVNRRLVKLFPTSRFRRLLAIPLVALTLAAALQALVLPVYSQIDAGSCAVGGAVVADDDNPGLVSDCEALLAARDTLAGSTTLNWAESASIRQWEGVRLGGSPLRVTELNLWQKELDGVIPAEFGGLANLESLSLWSNQLTGEIPAELASLANLGPFQTTN